MGTFRLGSVHWLGDPGDIAAGAGDGRAHDCGRRIEISTAGLRKSVRDYYPTGELLHCFRHAEVPITFSSDAHHAEDICWGICDAQRYAFDHGYRTFDIPHADGIWEAVELA